MANIRIKDLPVEGAPKADDRVPIDLGTTRQATVESFVTAGRPTATKADAEAGTDPKKAMTPLTVKQAIDAQVGPNFVHQTRQVIAGSGLTGGGALTGDVTVSLNSASVASLAKADSAVQTVNGKSGNAVTLSKSDVGLSNVDNTSDAAKPISTATQGALDGKFNNPTGDTSQYIRGNGTLATFPAIPQGTVTSVGVSVPAGFSAGGSPVTGAGTIAITYASGYQGYTTVEATKLSGVAASATANQTDAYLLSRANHTGEQAISTVTGLQTALDGKLAVDGVAADSDKLGGETAQEWADKINVGGIYDTKAAVVAANVPVAVNAIRLNGSASVGDGLGGLYVDVDNGSTDTVVSGDARTWYRVRDVSLDRLPVSANNWSVSVSAFGSVGAGQDAYPAIQAMLNYISGKGITGIIPNGDYPLSDTLKVPAAGNFTLECGNNAYIGRDFTGVSPSGYLSILTSQASGAIVPDVNISGGVWDIKGHIYGAANIWTITSPLRWRVSGATFKNVVDVHAIDVQRFDEFTVENCKFLGYKNADGARIFSEAIQLDPGLSTAPFPGDPNGKNVTVRGCYFGLNPERTEPGWSGWGGGVGNHSTDGTIGGYHDNILIENNEFVDCIFGAVRPFCWKNVTIRGNKFKTIASGRGVHITPTFMTNVSGQSPTRNIIVEGNTFTGAGQAVLIAPPGREPDMFKANDIIIRNNIINYSGGLQPILATWVNTLVISGNTITGGGAGGGVEARFISNASINFNIFESFTTGINIVETTETAYIGTLLTRNIDVANNRFTTFGGRAVFLNCAVTGVNISNNSMVDVAYSGSACIGIAGGASGVHVIGNQYRFRDQVAAAFGVQTGGSSNVQVIGNDFVLAATPIHVTSTGNSNVDMFTNSTPEAKITAPVGSVARVIGLGLFVKETGTGNTGWIKK